VWNKARRVQAKEARILAQQQVVLMLVLLRPRRMARVPWWGNRCSDATSQAAVVPSAGPKVREMARHPAFSAYPHQNIGKVHHILLSLRISIISIASVSNECKGWSGCIVSISIECKGYRGCINTVWQARFVQYGAEGDSIYLCKDDDSVYTYAFSYMWLDTFLARHKKDKVVKAMWAEAKRNMKPNAEITFMAEQIEQQEGMELTVEKKYSVLNALEWTAAMGQAPKVKTTRWIPTMMVPTMDDGGMETVWVVQYDFRLPFRTLSCKRKLASTRGRPLLKEADHVFAKQGEELLQWSATAQQAQWQVDSLMSKVVKPIQHYMAKLGVNPVTLGLVASQNTAQVEGSFHAEGSFQAAASAESEADEEAAEHPEGSMDVDQASTAGSATSRVTTRPRLLHMAKMSSTPSPSPVKVEQARSAASGAALRKGSSVASLAASSLLEREKGGAGLGSSPEDQVASYIQKLDIVSAMGGTKLGVQCHHAEVLLGKMSSKPELAGQCKKLKNHMKIFSLAEALNPSKLPQLEKVELSAALRQVREHAEIPPSVLAAVLTRCVNDELPRATDRESIERIIKLVWPWPTGPDKLDMHRPALSCIDLPMGEKTKLFQTFFTQLLQQTIAAMSPGDEDLLKSTSELLSEMADKVSMSEESMDEDAGAFLCELSTAIAGLVGLMDVTGIFTNANGEQIFEEMRQLKATGNTARPVVQACALAVADCPHLRTRLLRATENEAGVLEIRPVVAAALGHVSASKSNPDLAERVASMKSALDLWPRVITTLQEEDITKPWEVSILQALQQIVSTILPSGGGDPDQGDLKLGLGLVSEAASVFPMDTTVPTWVAQFTKLVAEGDRKGSVDEVKKVLAQTTTADQANAHMSLLEGLLGKLSFAGLSDGIVDMMVVTASALIDLASESFPGQLVGRVHSVCSDLCRDIPEDKSPERLQIMQQLVDGASLATAVGDVTERHPYCDKEEWRKGTFRSDDVRVGSLLVLIEKVGEHLGTDKRMFKECDSKAFEQMQALFDQAVENRIKIGSILRELLVEEAEPLKEQLHSVKGGLSEGADWMAALDDNQCKEWNQFFAAARQTIMKDKAVASMKDSVNKLAKAPRAGAS